MRPQLAICVLLGACGDNAQQHHAGPIGNDARIVDGPGDAPGDAPLTGFTIGGTALGIRSPVVLALTSGTDTQHVAVNADGAFQFPGRTPVQATWTVTTATPSCDVVGGSGTDIAANVTNVELYCIGVVELADLAFATGTPPVAYASVLTPAFDPGALTYTGTRPFFMDDVDMISVTPTAAYPTLPSISVYTDPTLSGQASPPHAVGATVPVRLQHPPTLDQTYQFTLVPAKPVQTSFVKASTPTAVANFGPVAISANVLVVGAPGQGGTGGAFVLRRGATGWTEEQLLQPTADAGAKAGNSVAIDGDVLVVGAPSDAADDSGRAYVYRYNPTSSTWVLDAGGTLAATSPAALAHCGASVAISASQIIIGCPGEKGKGNATNVGAVYMFRYDAPTSTWVADGTFKGVNANDLFGSAVALSGTSAVVGAPYEDDGTTTDAGGVHVLVRGASSWTQQGTTLRGDLTANAHFGAAVAISGDYAVVGASDISSGFAYVFHRVTAAWSLDGPKLAPTLAVPEFAQFGTAVAIDGTHVVIGAPLEDAAGGDVGAIHAYRREPGGWTNSHVLAASNPSISRFGASVTVDGEWLAVGAPIEGTSAADSGAVYVFR